MSFFFMETDAENFIFRIEISLLHNDFIIRWFCEMIEADKLTR